MPYATPAAMSMLTPPSTGAPTVGPPPPGGSNGGGAYNKNVVKIPDKVKTIFKNLFDSSQIQHFELVCLCAINKEKSEKKKN